MRDALFLVTMLSFYIATGTPLPGRRALASRAATAARAVAVVRRRG
jgi:hypothetical protein